MYTGEYLLHTVTDETYNSFVSRKERGRLSDDSETRTKS